LDFLRKNNLIDELNFFCVDNRVQDNNTGVFYIINEDKKRKTPLPPHIKEVPALLLVRDQYKCIVGKEIINYFAPKLKNVFIEVNTPQPQPLNDDKINGSIYGDNNEFNKDSYIKTPPENNITNKLDKTITINLIEKQRNAELENIFDQKYI
jgi:hypothetical protein